MMEFGELSDWIWLGAVTIWLLMRIVPRLLGKGSKAAPSPVGGAQRAARRGAARATRPRLNGPDAFEQTPEPATGQRVDSSTPIEPR